MTSLPTYSSAGWSISAQKDSDRTWGICPALNNGYPFLTGLTTASC
jgi:hypothetical protein